MKALKLFSLFLLLLAITVGSIWISELLEQSSSDRIDGKYTESFKKAKDQIEKEWQNSEDWSIEHFLDTKNYLSVRKEKLGKTGYATLEDRFQVKALDCLYKKTIALFSNPYCKNAEVKKFYDDMNRFCKEAPKQSAAEQLDTLQSIHKVYKRAYELIQKEIGLSTKFNQDANKDKKQWWSDFNQYESDIIGKRNSIKKESSYARISNIIEIENGLEAITGKLTNAESAFLSELIKNIDECFKPYMDEIKKCTSKINDITEQDELDNVKNYKEGFEKKKNLLLNMRRHFHNQFEDSENECKKIDNIADRMSNTYSSFEKTLKEAEKRVESMKNKNAL